MTGRVHPRPNPMQQPWKLGTGRNQNVSSYQFAIDLFSLLLPRLSWMTCIPLPPVLHLFTTKSAVLASLVCFRTCVHERQIPPQITPYAAEQL
ncbi:hypothetical protein EMPG_10209, partial [Blastomyces silverae]